MCGIGGFFRPQPVEPRWGAHILERINRIQHHRGPDGEGTWLDASAGVGLAHRRLSIIDLATGAQGNGNGNGHIIRIRENGGESAATRELYGLERAETADFGRACLIARRLLERGVRFVQLFSGGTFGSPRRNWDGHEDMRANHGQEALRIDRPVAALLREAFTFGRFR